MEKEKLLLFSNPHSDDSSSSVGSVVFDFKMDPPVKP